MPTEQRHIATALNLSKATVSKSLRNDPLVSAATRARVHETAIRMGYRPRFVVGRQERPLAPANLTRPADHQNATGFIHLGVLSRGINPNGPPEVVSMRQLHGMTVAARVQRVALHNEPLSDEEFDHLDDPSTWPPTLGENLVSGIALLSHPSDRVLQALAKRFPCIQFFWSNGDIAADCVTDDSLRSIGQLMTHLAGLGHQRIGLADFGYTTPSQQARFAGYIKWLVEHNMEYCAKNARFLDGLPPHEQRVEQVADQVEQRGRKAGVSAWICTDDYLGYTLIGELNQRGIRVPDDVSVCGFDNFSPPAELPKLTTIDSPFEKMGAVAVRRLVQRITDPSAEPEHIMLGCRLIVGQSTGPAHCAGAAYSRNGL